MELGSFWPDTARLQTGAMWVLFELGRELEPGSIFLSEDPIERDPNGPEPDLGSLIVLGFVDVVISDLIELGNSKGPSEPDLRYPIVFEFGGDITVAERFCRWSVVFSVRL